MTDTLPEILHGISQATQGLAARIDQLTASFADACAAEERAYRTVMDALDQAKDAMDEATP